MKQRQRTIWFLTLVMLVVAAGAPQASTSWQCEGRACGTTPWYCCCLSPAEGKDEHCPEPEANSVAAQTGACPSTSCQCTMTVRTSDTASAQTGTTLPAIHVASLPIAAATLAPMPLKALARELAPRGPPRPLVALASNPLRGPPVA